MKRTINLLILFALILGLAAMPTGSVVQAASDDAGVYLVRFEDGIPADFADQVAALGGNVDFTHEIGIAIVSGFTVESAAELSSVVDAAAILPDFAVEMAPTMGDNLSMIAGVPESPTDPTLAAFYSWQWNMRAVDADYAWAAGRFGSPDVTVAILDTGIDYTYPDLDGLVDLSRSVSFVPEDDFYVDLFFPGKHHITDIHYHGTHVAATVASNAYVAAGITSQTTLMGVKVCSAVLGYCPGTAIVQGLLHAVDNGADVVNMSLGGGFIKSEEPGYVGFVNSLYNYANSMGVLVVVSAGNESIDLDHDKNGYKTYCNTPNTVCVSATGPVAADDIYDGPWYDVDAPAYYTNYGKSVINVAAPGGSSGGYVWAACSQTSLVIPACQTGIYVVGLGGTSMAAPHVSGLASLLVEDFGRNPGRIKTYIQQTADDLGKPGVDAFYGKGRINVGEAVAP